MQGTQLLNLSTFRGFSVTIYHGLIELFSYFYGVSFDQFYVVSEIDILGIINS